MAFKNKYGKLISYECSDLIAELQQDIAEFSDITVAVIVEKIDDIIIYKDYDFIIDGEYELTPRENEGVVMLKASTLMELYKEQNKLM